MVASSTHSKILILDFGSQYTQVISRRIRECQVYSEIVRFDTPAAEIAAAKPKGIILSGGPASVYDKGAPQMDPKIFSLGIPVLGICYGLMLMAHHLGGQVVFTGRREYGAGMLHIKNGSQLFSDGCAAAQGNRRPAHLHFCKQWTATRARGRNCAARFRREFPCAFEIRGRERALSRAAQRRDRSRNKAKIDRQRIHQSISEGDGGIARGRPKRRRPQAQRL